MRADNETPTKYEPAVVSDTDLLDLFFDSASSYEKAVEMLRGIPVSNILYRSPGFELAYGLFTPRSYYFSVYPICRDCGDNDVLGFNPNDVVYAEIWKDPIDPEFLEGGHPLFEGIDSGLVPTYRSQLTIPGSRCALCTENRTREHVTAALKNTNHTWHMGANPDSVLIDEDDKPVVLIRAETLFRILDDARLYRDTAAPGETDTEV